MDPFKILGIPSGSTQDEIKKAFRRKAHEHHPDKGGDPAKFKEVQKAYEQCLRGGGLGDNSSWKAQEFNQAWFEEMMRAFEQHEERVRQRRTWTYGQPVESAIDEALRRNIEELKNLNAKMKRNYPKT